MPILPLPAASPSFTVVIPCYNDARFLTRAVQSAVNQTRGVDQIIVVDDGSSDTTRMICEHLAQRIGCLRYVYQRNAGVSAARNHGLQLTQSEYVVFLDADDELLPGAISHYTQAIRERKNEKSEWLIGASRSVREHRKRLRSVAVPKNPQRAFRAYLRKSLHLGNISNMCFETSTIARINFPETLRFSEDFVVFAILLSRYRPVIVRAVVAHEHRRPHSLRSTVDLQSLLANDVARTLFDSPQLPAECQQYRRVYAARHAHSVVKQAYREHVHATATVWYATLLRNAPQRILNVKLLVRYLRSCWLKHREAIEQRHENRANLG